MVERYGEARLGLSRAGASDAKNTFDINIHLSRHFLLHFALPCVIKPFRRTVMDGSRTREALAEFLDYLADKGLMEKATAQARKAAASKILGVLDRPDADDVTNLDLDDVLSRFSRLHGKDYTPQSLVTYKSRLSSAIDDFRSYLSNPMAFRPALRNKERAKPKAVQGTSPAASPPTQEARPEPARSSPVPMAAVNIIPIPIRADLTVFIQGLPFDLTESEARKIAGVVTAMAQA